MEHLKNLEEEEDVKISFSLSPEATKMTNLEKEIDSLLKTSTPTVKVFGICGGSSCGKSKITQYFVNKIEGSIVIAEKDFFNVKEEKKPRKKSFYDDKENLFAVSNSQDGYAQERKQKLIDLNDPECYDWDNLLVRINIYCIHI